MLASQHWSRDVERTVTAMHITGRCDVQGSTGDVLRLVGTGHARLLDLSKEGSPRLASPRNVAFESVVTLTSATTFQEIGELSLADGASRLSFVTMGSGYVIDGKEGGQRMAVSLSRSIPAHGVDEEVAVVTSRMVFDPLGHTCGITAVVFGAFPGA